MERVLSRAVLTAVAAGATLLAASSTFAAPTASANGGGASAEHARIAAYWTPERRAAAIPRDLVIDERGLGYLRKPDGSLQPYGHTVAAAAGRSPEPKAKPGGGSGGPSVNDMDPQNKTIGSAYTFKATVTDDSGVRSVSFKVGRPGGRQQSFSASQGSSNVWTVSLSGFTDGDWTWSVVAKDNANNTTTTGAVSFKVDTSTGGGGGGGSDGAVIANARYGDGGALQNAVGRIYFEMPSNARRTRWAGYVCSGTVVDDGSNTNDRSVVQTAAHCVYDDANKAFARNVLFIPNQDGTTGTGTDLECSNDPLGCWAPSFGVVDHNWTTRTFPDNIPWDYAYYVVPALGAHRGTATPSETLDAVVTPISVSFAQPSYSVPGSLDDYTTALGYSYSDDPFFMYCAEDMTELDGGANWWLASCGLSGGSSGGPWMQGNSLISVNSWGYTNEPGMAGPKLFGTSASCVYTEARTANVTSAADGDEGVAKSCPQ